VRRITGGRSGRMEEEGMEEMSVRSEGKEEWSAVWCGKTVRERSGRKGG
jgi:hypothetical protein